MANCVIEKSTGDVIRTGGCDFVNDGSFDPETQLMLTNVPGWLIVRDNWDGSPYHRWNSDTEEWEVVE